MAIKEFWSDMVTRRSWEILLDLKMLPFEFILIGGWAAFLWTKAHKSKDIDIVLKDFKTLDYLKQHYDLRKNEQLRKYEIKIDEIDIDIYVPFFSKFVIPLQDLKNCSTKLEGIDVIIPEALLILKQAAEIDRRGSIKGEKDAIDIMTLVLSVDVDFKKYRALLEKYGLPHLSGELSKVITAFSPKNIAYLGLNQREFKIRKAELLKKLKSE
ncbi:Uncharacterised protein [uncultured archaeon]|nr:Uncharacterised protein [uncultured archaeon]